MITGIIVALPDEITTLSKGRLSKGKTLAITDSITLCCSGAGPDNAKIASEKLLAQGAKRLISWGCAAALKDNLKPGDLILASELIAESGIIYHCAPQWQRQINTLLGKNLSIKLTSLAESSKLVTTQAQKQALQQQTGAAIVDMESTAVAKIATEKQIPFVAIRAVADSLQMDLPDAIAIALNASGDIQLTKLPLYLLTHPTEITSLIRLGKSFVAAKKTLSVVAEQLITISDFHAT